MKEVQCPTCNSKEMTLIKSSEKEDGLKYTYLCRKCKEPFYVNIKTSTSK